MRQLFSVLVALFISTRAIAGVIKVRPGEPIPRPDKPDPQTSAGIFVGVRDFVEDEELAPVKYAVDDAVDLAYALSIERQPLLLRPDRIALALSGEPQKAESQQHLQELLSAGAMRYSASQSEILKLLKSRAGTVGRSGILVVSFSTHGVSEDGTQYLLTATSLLDDLETAVSEAKVCDIVSRNRVARSLILIDACRERLMRDRRNDEVDPRSAAVVSDEMENSEGQVVLSAASAGDYAYDDDTRRNGVFTAAVIDGLHCDAETDDRGFVTVDTLYTFVQNRVLEWIHKNKNRETKRATQLHYEGQSKWMPLAACITRTASSVPPRAH